MSHILDLFAGKYTIPFIAHYVKGFSCTGIEIERIEFDKRLINYTTVAIEEYNEKTKRKEELKYNQ